MSQKGRKGDAKFYSKRIKKNPKDWVSFFERGRIYFDEGKIEKSIRDYTSSLAINPLNQHSFFSRGLAYGVIRKHELCIKDFTRTLELAKLHGMKNEKFIGDVLGGRGISYRELGKYRESLEDFEISISLHPNSSTHNNYAVTLMKVGHCGKAEFHYNKSIEMDPTNANAHANRGKFRAEFQNNFNGAYQDFQRALELDPNSYAAKTGLFNMKLIMGKYKDKEKINSELFAKDLAENLEMNPLAAKHEDGFVSVNFGEGHVPPAGDIHDVMKCENCKKFDAKLMVCSGCKKIRYCSHKCQKTDWKRHKKICKK